MDARIWLPEVREVFLIDAIPLQGGGVLASGHASTDGGIVGFVAKTMTTEMFIAAAKRQRLSCRPRMSNKPDVRCGFSDAIYKKRMRTTAPTLYCVSTVSKQACCTAIFHETRLLFARKQRLEEVVLRGAT